MKTRKWWIFAAVGILALLAASAFWFVQALQSVRSYDSFTLEDGTVFRYFEYAADDPSVEMGGVAIRTASRERLIAAFGAADPEISGAEDAVSTAEQAARLGAAAMGKHLENWTYDGHMGVMRNEAADVWVVHGQLRDQSSSGRIGVAVMDAASGKVIAMGSVESDAD